MYNKTYKVASRPLSWYVSSPNDPKSSSVAFSKKWKNYIYILKALNYPAFFLSVTISATKKQIKIPYNDEHKYQERFILQGSVG